MKAEQAKKVADQALEQLSQALAVGRSEELTRYLSMLAKFHKYSFGNVMLILSQRPDATHVAGFNTWKQMGRFVRQGEKGIVIIAPMAFRKQEKQPTDSDKPETVLRFHGVYVFDVSQTDGQPLPEPAGVETKASPAAPEHGRDGDGNGLQAPQEMLVGVTQALHRVLRG